MTWQERQEANGFCGDCSADEVRPWPSFSAEVDGRRYCGRHWVEAGRPCSRRRATVAEAHAAEVKTRERMTARGGAHAHLVRKGLT